MIRFLYAAVREAWQGSNRYRAWILVLLLIAGYGLLAYVGQLRHGLVVTGMSDQVSWGFYIANFAFLVGIAAAAVLLVIPAYAFHRKDVKEVVLLGEAMAVAAVTMAMMFVIADLGRPDRIWHMIPILGRFNFPISLLAWDVVVLSGYLALNLCIPFYILFKRWRGEEPSFRLYFPFVVLAMFWAISIHTVTAFLFSANSGRAFWHTSLLAPRFIASAFASGPALIIISLQILRRVTGYPVKQSVIDMLAIIMMISMQITVFFIIAELFTDFYNEGAHAASIHYLFFGLQGLHGLRNWIWASLIMNVAAMIILTVNPLRKNGRMLNVAAVLAFSGIWIEKGMGLVIPGYIPTPLGEVFEYSPTSTEVAVSMAIWAIGLLIFTILAKVAIAIETGRVKAAPGLAQDTA